MQLSINGLKLLQQFEGFRSHPYLDGGGKCTIGYGSTYYLNGKSVTMHDAPLPQQQASDLQLAVINRDFAPKIANVLQSQITSGFVNQNMFDACVSLAYNIGINGFTTSSVVRNIKAGLKKQAGDSFLLWDKDNGKVVQGLINRRNAERKLFLS